MNMFFRWLYSRLRRVDLVESENCVKVSSLGHSNLESRGMSFTIHQANGGHVLEYSSYDKKTDKRNNSLHIISVDQDLGQQIAHAITIETLKY